LSTAIPLLDVRCPDPRGALDLANRHGARALQHLRERRRDVAQLAADLHVAQRSDGHVVRDDVDAAVLPGDRLGEEREVVDPHGRVVGEGQLRAHLPCHHGLRDRRGAVVDADGGGDQDDESGDAALDPQSLARAASRT
jgi:hypothetical protein